MVKDLLVNYKDYETEIEIFKSFEHEMSVELAGKSKEMECLNKCIALLEDEEADIIKMLYFKHDSIKTVADKYGYTKSGMQYKRNKIVTKLSALFERASKYINAQILKSDRS